MKNGKEIHGKGGQQAIEATEPKDFADTEAYTKAVT